jgi:hypothetical protein
MPRRSRYTANDIMNTNNIFMNRRQGDDRRIDRDPCRNLPLDIYHRKRRKAIERRDIARSLAGDYLAFLGQGSEHSKH